MRDQINLHFDDLEVNLCQIKACEDFRILQRQSNELQNEYNRIEKRVVNSLSKPQSFMLKYTQGVHKSKGFDKRHDKVEKKAIKRCSLIFVGLISVCPMIVVTLYALGLIDLQKTMPQRNGESQINPVVPEKLYDDVMIDFEDHKDIFNSKLNSKLYEEETFEPLKPRETDRRQVQLDLLEFAEQSFSDWDSLPTILELPEKDYVSKQKIDQ